MWHSSLILALRILLSKTDKLPGSSFPLQSSTQSTTASHAGCRHPGMGCPHTQAGGQPGPEVYLASGGQGKTEEEGSHSSPAIAAC